MDKLSKMRDYLSYLREMRQASLEEFIEDFRLRGAAERYLHLAIECIIDISGHIIASMRLRKPEHYGDMPFILSDAGVIPLNFAESMAAMVGFRNILVHDYARIDSRLVYEFMLTRTKDFETFMKYVVDFLKKTG